MDAYARGRVAIANALGTGIADGKLIYAFATRMIRYYPGEEATLENVPNLSFVTRKPTAFMFYPIS